MIPVCEPTLDGNEEKYISDCLRTNWVSSAGKYLKEFEEKFSRYCGAKHGIACSNATTGLHVAMLALGLGPGDEVIIPDFTLIVSANTVILCGARPVLVDVEPDTGCIDASKIEEKITARTKAIMAVHMYGHPCDMERIREIARQRKLFVIEDAAQAHGAEVKGRRVGGLSDAGIFSFYGNKILTTGEGGMVLCHDDALAAKVRLLINQGFQEPRFVHAVMGYNYRLTNLQAAMGVAQLEKADEKVSRKREIARLYTERLKGHPNLELPVERPWAKSVYWMYGIVLADHVRVSRGELMKGLRDAGVDTRAFFHPMHAQPVYQGKDPRFPDCTGKYPVSDRLGQRGLYLPSGHSLTTAQIDDVTDKLKDLLGRP
jgi:perosamine synthetase